MAEFDGLANSFNQGVQSGQGDALRYAQMAGDMDLKKQRLDLDRQNLEETKRQRNMQVGQLFFGELDKISSMKSGKAKNARIKIMQGKGQELGLGNMEMLSALLQDEDGIAKIRGTLSMIYSLPAELQEKTFEEAHKYLGDEEIVSHLEKFQSTAAELLKTKQAKDLEARNKGSATPELVNKLSDDVAAWDKDYSRWAGVGQGIDNLVREYRTKDKKIDFSAMTGADDFQLLKSYLQFNDTPRVTEGEIATSQAAQGLLGRAQALAANWKEGDVLSAQLRKDIYNSSQKLLKVINEGRKDRLAPILEQTKALGVKPEKVFGPQLLKKLRTDVPDIELFGAGMGGSSSEAQPLGGEPKPMPNPTPQPMYKTAGKSDVPPPDHTMVLREYTKKNPALVGETQKLFGQLGANTDKFKELATKSGLPQDLVEAIIAERGKKKSGSK